MIYSGLLSVTFRQLKPDVIVGLVQKAGLQAIEWGGDIHVPHGNMGAALDVGAMTRDSGLAVASYGSYYRAGIPDSANVEFEGVLETAVTLGAPSIRVWAGNKGSELADEAWRAAVAADTRRIAELAAKAGVTIDFEYHRGTLTDTAESTLRLLEDVNHPNVRCNWQPPIDETAESRLESLRRISPWLANIHVFHWINVLRCPLKDGAGDWSGYAEEIGRSGRTHYMMLEFVKDDSPEQFLQDAETLKRIIRECAGRRTAE